MPVIGIKACKIRVRPVKAVISHFQVCPPSPSKMSDPSVPPPGTPSVEAPEITLGSLYMSVRPVLIPVHPHLIPVHPILRSAQPVLHPVTLPTLPPLNSNNSAAASPSEPPASPIHCPVLALPSPAPQAVGPARSHASRATLPASDLTTIESPSIITTPHVPHRKRGAEDQSGQCTKQAKKRATRDRTGPMRDK